MDCREAREKLLLATSDDLPSAEASELRSHLTSCAACRGEEARLADVFGRLATMKRDRMPESVRAGYWEGLSARLREEGLVRSPGGARSVARPARGISARLAGATVAAAVLVGAFLVGWFAGLFTQQEKGTEPPRAVRPDTPPPAPRADEGREREPIESAPATGWTSDFALGNGPADRGEGVYAEFVLGPEAAGENPVEYGIDEALPQDPWVASIDF
ncbi:MAG: zf-HC2 domain-containing protein [Planctomycetes bacterium]|nr:zf-HC2 domain-containing protein [Planctomycetota bacterium]